jgi:hypothetical protein
MGQRRDFEIRTWQEKAGIEEAGGETAVLLRQMSDTAFELSSCSRISR